ncbi:hypothetical protein [Roseateles asaccharophilus]|uniref:Baseplate protein J-like domain-containing protein n=1 Tax=Roseateles asaccharophilus TaxID=582607 RepID=A0ABU2AF35_9BURK|nr:hypothetical protein [Roseateles asaccharophilus]MDR7334593.1 hypothetical protein [Roseateles asaccharophilus]
MSQGTDQQDRFPRALEPGYFRPGDLDFPQRAEMTGRLAERLRFHDLNHQETGHWGDLFTNDPTLMMARIAAFDIGPAQRKFLEHVNTAPLPDLGLQVLELAFTVDGWWAAMRGCEEPAPRQLGDRIELLIVRQLAADLHWVERRFLQQTVTRRPADSDKRELSSLWRRSGNSDDDGTERSDREKLRERFFAFLTAADDIATLARELLPTSLASGRHEPAAALVIAFLMLCDVVQQEVNRLPARHANFYLRDCLGFGPQPPRPDHVHLACERDPRAGAEVQLLPGTVFEAGKDAAGRPVRFVSEAALAITDLRVASLYTLRLEHDPLIAPECHLGYVTRSKLTQPVPDGRSVWSLFGGRAAKAQDARIGLALASPLLLLSEGEREIRLLLRRSGTGPGLSALRDAVLQARSPEVLREALGALLVNWLLAASDSQDERARAEHQHIPGDLSPADWKALREVIHDMPEAVLPSIFAGSRTPRRAHLFTHLLQGSLRLSLSSERGWLDVDCRLERIERPAAGTPPGTLAGCDLGLRIRLKPEAAAIVGCDPILHGEEWPTRLPVLRLELSSLGRLYPYSLLAQLSLAAAELTVTARGLRQLHLENHLGRLDATKGFMPFGPMPSLSSYFVIGSPEAARKTLDRLWLDVEWGGLPPDAGGFDAHYAGYGEPAEAALRQGRFSTSSAWLRDGQWQDCRLLPGHEQLFGRDKHSRELQAGRRIEIDPGSLRQSSRASGEDWQRMPLPRNGLCRLQLAGPRPAFGHAAYPMALAAAVAANARRRKPEPLPNPPYTPLIERLSLSYVAHSVIALDRDDEPADGVDGERIFHLHPLGLQPLTSGTAGGHALLPDLGDAGNLYIGLSGQEASGLLTLLFELQEPLAGSADGDLARPRLRWATLCGDTWRPLPQTRVLDDTTHGGLTSGIVSLDLPRDMDSGHRIMPSGLFWLRASATGGFERFAGLVSVRTQGLRLRRELDTSGRAAPPVVLGAGAIVRPAAGVPGLAAVTQVGRSFGLRREEDDRALLVRAGERLQHKGRASLGWDVERLLLEQFPEVRKVRCIPARDGSGRVTVVVVPRVPSNDPALACSAPRFNAVDLARMAEALRAVASPFADLRVRNPAYDRLQLRATLRLRPGAHEGATLRRVNEAVVQAISPWGEDGPGPRFDWLVRSEDLDARIRQLGGVDGVSRLSLLTLTCDDEGLYQLRDTALAALGPQPPGQDGDRPARGAAHARARLPWSLALPLPQHILSVADETTVPGGPQPTGVDRLTIGTTFVIGRASP